MIDVVSNVTVVKDKEDMLHLPLNKKGITAVATVLRSYGVEIDNNMIDHVVNAIPFSVILHMQYIQLSGMFSVTFNVMGVPFSYHTNMDMLLRRAHIIAKTAMMHFIHQYSESPDVYKQYMDFSSLENLQGLDVAQLLAEIKAELEA